jgi:FixJ family two-component response regulator
MIQIVENDCAVRDSLRLLLDCVGLEARGFPSSEAFLDGWRPAVADCVVVDAHMPGMNGLDLLEEIRRRGDEVPAIVVTGQPTATNVARAKAAGALAVLEMPYKAAEIVALVRAALEKKRG